MELKVQSERVVAAAEKCADARRILMDIFPEAFASKGFTGNKYVVPIDLQATAASKDREYLATSHPGMVAAYRKGAGYTTDAVVVVLTNSTSSSPNGWSYSSWEQFFKAWKLVDKNSF